MTASDFHGAPAPLPDAEPSGIAAELALRDRELAALRDALAAERADAQTARAALESQLRDAARAAGRRAQLEQALAEQRDARARLLDAADAAQARTLAAEAAIAELATARGELECQRDEAHIEAAEALTILAATEHRVGTLQQEAARREAALAEARREAALLAASLDEMRAQLDPLAVALAESDAWLIERDAALRLLIARERELDAALAAAAESTQATLVARDAALDTAATLAVEVEVARGEVVSLHAALAEAIETQAALRDAAAAALADVVAARSAWDDERQRLQGLCASADLEATRWRAASDAQAARHDDERRAAAAELETAERQRENLAQKCVRLEAERLAAQQQGESAAAEAAGAASLATALQSELTAAAAAYDALDALAEADRRGAAQQIAAQQDELDATRTALAAAEIGLEATRAALEESQCGAAARQAELDALQTAVADAQRRGEVLQVEVAARQAALVAAQREQAETCERLQAEVAQRSLAADTLASEREALHVALAEARVAARQEIGAHAAAHEAAAARLAALQDEHGALQAANGALQQAHHAAETALHEQRAACRQLQEELSERGGQIGELHEQREALRAALAEAAEVAERLAARSAAHDELQGRFGALQAEHAALHGSLEEAARASERDRVAAAQQYASLVGQLAAHEAQQAALQATLMEATASSDAQRAAHDAVQRELEAARAAHEAAAAAAQQELVAREAGLAQLRDQLAEAQATGAALDAAQAELCQRAAAVERLEAEVHAQRAAAQALAAQRDALGEAAMRAEAAASAAQGALQEHQSAGELLRAERDGLRDERDALRQALSDAATALEAAAARQRELDRLAASAEALQAQLAERELSLAASRADNDALRAAQAAALEAQAQLAQRAEEQQALLATLPELQAHAERQAATIAALESRLSTAHADQGRAADEAQARWIAAQQEAESLRGEIAELNGALSVSAERQCRLAAEQETLADRCTALAGRLSDSEQARRTLDASAVAAEARAKSAAGAEQAARDNEARLAALLNGVQQELAELQAVHMAGDSAARELQREHDEALRACAAAVAALEDAQTRNAALEADRLKLVEEGVAAADSFASRERDLRRSLDTHAADLCAAHDALAVAQAALGETAEALAQAVSPDDLQRERAAAAAAMQRLEAELAAARAALDELQSAYESESGARAALGDELAALRAEGDAAAATWSAQLASAEAAHALLCEERDALVHATAQHGGEREELLERVQRLETGMLAARETEQRLVADAQQRSAALAQLQAELARSEAARDRFSEELILAQQQLEARRTTSEQLALRLEAAERECEQAQERQQRISEQALDLQQQLLDDEGRMAGLALERDQAVRARVELESTLEDTHALHAAALVQAEETRVAEAAQRHLQARSEEADRQRGELLRMQARLEELERQQSDAAQRHSQAVSLYMLELNQRSDALRQRDLEVQRLEEQLRLLELACEEGAEHVAMLRNERDALEAQRAAGVPAERAAAAPNAEVAAPRNDKLRLAGADDTALDDAIEALERLGSAPAARPRPSARAEQPRGESGRGEGGELRLVEKSAGAPRSAEPRPSLIVHVEDHVPLRDVLRAEVERCSGARYAVATEVGESGHGQQPLLAVNLLAKEVDPFSTICDARWGRGEPRAFTYLAAGSRGIISGIADFIPYPFEADECATRLLERPGGTQRLLMVSDKIEVMNEIRAVLNRVRCSTSLALDGRQAFDLVGMVKPDAILIDLTLPRGEGLRLVGRLRADAKTAGISIIFALGEALDVGRFRADATRVLADSRFAPEELSGAFAQVLTEWRNGQDELRAAG